MEVKDREDKDIRQPDLKSMNMEELRNWVTGIQGEADISVVSCEACGRNGGDDQSAEKPQREDG